jgi:acid phosphatase (class A)
MRNISALKLALIVVLGLTSNVMAEDAKPFADSNEINLLTLLPPPPANGSEQMQKELAEVLTIQVTRTPAMEERAKADAVEDIWRFSDVINNPNFTKEKLPKLSAFFDRIVATEGAITDPAKEAWKRPRPHLYSDLVKPVVKLSSSGAYPSGHTTVGTLMGIVLAEMVPEKRPEIMTRAWEYGYNRLVAGIHFMSDIEAGRISGTVIAQTIRSHPDYQAEFEAARTELRSALELPAEAK